MRERERGGKKHTSTLSPNPRSQYSYITLSSSISPFISFPQDPHLQLPSFVIHPSASHSSSLPSHSLFFVLYTPLPSHSPPEPRSSVAFCVWHLGIFCLTCVFVLFVLPVALLTYIHTYIYTYSTYIHGALRRR